jgi:hypothetical protein
LVIVDWDGIVNLQSVDRQSPNRQLSIANRQSPIGNAPPLLLTRDRRAVILRPIGRR